MDIHKSFVSELFVGNFIFELEPICFHTSIAIISIQLNSFKYCNLKLIIVVDISHLFAYSEVVMLHMYHSHDMAMCETYIECS